MRSVFNIFVVGLMLTCMLASCGIWDDSMGYPTKVTFPKEGGTITIIGDGILIDGGIYDTDYNQYAEFYTDGYRNPNPDTVTMVGKWLTVTYVNRERKITFTAEPSESKKSRKLIFEADSYPQILRITVKQH